MWSKVLQTDGSSCSRSWSIAVSLDQLGLVERCLLLLLWLRLRHDLGLRGRSGLTQSGGQDVAVLLGTSPRSLLLAGRLGAEPSHWLVALGLLRRSLLLWKLAHRGIPGRCLLLLLQEDSLGLRLCGLGQWSYVKRANVGLYKQIYNKFQWLVIIC